MSTGLPECLPVSRAQKKPPIPERSVKPQQAAGRTALMKVNEILPTCLLSRYYGGMSDPIQWMGTREACERLGVTLRTLYRFIDEGQLPAYKMGRVIRVQASDVDDFISRMRIEPGTLEHLYPEPKPREARQMAGDSHGEVDPEETDF